MPVIPYGGGSWADTANRNEEQPSTEEVGQGVLANMAEGLSNSVFGGASLRAGMRLGFDLKAQGAGEPFVSPQDANQQATDAGVKLSGVGESGISQNALSVLIDHQQHEQEREQIIQRSGQTGVAGFLERVVGDPMIAVPFGAGADAVKVGGGLLARAARGAAEAGAETAGIEAVNYPVQRYSGDDYTMMDSLRNVALGVGMGGIFGAGAHVVDDFAARRDLRMHALAQIGDDRPVDVGQFSLDAGRFNAHTVGTGEDLANSQLTVATNPTARDEALMAQYREPPKPHPDTAAELQHVNNIEDLSRSPAETQEHPANPDELAEAVTNEISDTKTALAHAPAAIKPSNVLIEERPDKVMGTSGFRVTMSDGGRIVGDIRNNEWRISTASAGEPGKGAGTQAYTALADHILSRGKTLTSDSEVSPPAARIYEKLKEAGYTVERNPNATIDENNKLTTLNRGPVFKITARPKTSSPAETELDTALAAVPTNDNYIKALREGVNCARMNGSP